MDETTKARREQATPGATLWRHVEVSHVRRGLQFLIKSVPRSWSGCCAATLDALCVGVGVTLGFAGVVVRVGPTPLIGRMLALTSRHGAMPFTVAAALPATPPAKPQVMGAQGVNQRRAALPAARSAIRA